MKTFDEMVDEDEKAIAEAGVPNEEQLRGSDAPWPDTLEELTAYIKQLVERPHSYGTVVYAMSLAALAAFRFVSKRLGVTGFQASWADMDFMRRSRNARWLMLLDLEKLLYPQFLHNDNFPSWKFLLRKYAIDLGQRAAELMGENKAANLRVIKHWQRLIEDGKKAAAKKAAEKKSS